MAVTIHQRSTGVLLTKQDIEQWRAEVAALVQERDNLERRMGELEELIGTAEYFLKLTQPKAATSLQPAADIPLTDAIMKVFQRERRPLTASEIRTHLVRDPGQAERLKANPNYYHTAMSRLRERGQLIKVGDTHALPANENGALNGHAASAPEAGEAATSPIEDQEGFRLLG